jgi:hypothetical protein
MALADQLVPPRWPVWVGSESPEWQDTVVARPWILGNILSHSVPPNHTHTPSRRHMLSVPFFAHKNLIFKPTSREKRERESKNPGPLRPPPPPPRLRISDQKSEHRAEGLRRRSRPAGDPSENRRSSSFPYCEIAFWRSLTSAARTISPRLLRYLTASICSPFPRPDKRQPKP